MAIVAVTATFTGAEDFVAVTYAGITTNPPNISTGVCINDNPLGPVDCDLTSVSNTGCTVVPSARFSGTVELIVSD